MLHRRVGLLAAVLAVYAALSVPPSYADRKPFGGGRAVKQAPRTRSYDVLHTKLAISFDLEKKAIEGDARVTFKPLHANFRTLSLDFAGLTVRDVVRESAAGGGRLTHAHQKGVLSVDLGSPAGPDDTITVRVRYGGSPTQGLYFVGPDDGYPGKPRQCWSQGETEFNHFWFPCWDHPNDRATSEELYTVPAGYTAVGNGKLAEVRKEAATWTWQWRQDVAYPAYLVSVCVGKFETATEDADGVLLETHVPAGTPDAPATAARSFGKTAAMVRFYNAFLGVPYPYPRYAQTCVVDFLWGGMENISATTLTADTLHDAAAHLETESEPLVAHELAHQWFGDLLTCKTWGDIWLNEGFASYLEALWREKDLGRDEFLLDMRDSIGWYMGEDQEYRRPVSTDVYADPDDLFDGHTYAKGARVLWMLHALVGDEAFRAGLKLFLTRHREQCVETDDLRKAMEEVTKRDLAWFFDQWIRKPGYPEFEVSWTYDEDAKAVVLAVKQVQETADGTPLFRAPVPVEIVGESSAALHTVWVDSRD
ncbi:MAG: M1 family metallopeptidase, partial [Planctomycetales bacterium]|nr:M1 family metallopeptidase [Planctomycetales bacterium]